MARGRRLIALVAVIAAVALIATGCTGGGGSSTGGSTGGGTSSNAVVYKVGIGAPLTDGAVALGKGMVRGADLAIKQANESTTAKELGIKFESVQGDDKGDPTTGGNVATQFTSNPDLVGVMGHLNSGVTRVAGKIYNQANVIQVSPANTAVDITTFGWKNYFRTCTVDSIQGPVAADYAFKTAGKKAAYVVDDSTVYGVGLADAWAKQFAADGGKILGREKTSDKDTDFKALVSTIKSKNPDIVFYGGVYNAGALLSKQLKEGGVAAPMMAGDGCYDPEYIKLAGAANAKGDLATSVGYPVSKLPKGQDFKAAFDAAYPGAEIAAYDAYSYDAAMVIINAVYAAAKKVGADKVTTTEGRQAILDAAKASDFEGVTGKVQFDDKGDTLNKTITVYNVDAAGTWQPVTTEAR